MILLDTLTKLRNRMVQVRTCERLCVYGIFRIFILALVCLKEYWIEHSIIIPAHKMLLQFALSENFQRPFLGFGRDLLNHPTVGTTMSCGITSVPSENSRAPSIVTCPLRCASQNTITCISGISSQPNLNPKVEEFCSQEESQQPPATSTKLAVFFEEVSEHRFHTLHCPRELLVVRQRW